MPILNLLKLYFTVHCSNYDNRQPWKIKYEISDIFTIVVLGLFCGYKNLYNMPYFVEDHFAELEKFSIIHDGNIPSKNTFYRLLDIVDWAELTTLSNSLLSSLPEYMIKKIRNENSISMILDGKYIIGSKCDGVSNIDIVSLFDNKTGIVTAQDVVIKNNKDCEKYAMKNLIKNIPVGAYISMDAIACDTQTLKPFNKNGIFFVAALKDNNKKLHKTAKEIFSFIDKNEVNSFSFPLTKESEGIVERSYKRIGFLDPEWELLDGIKGYQQSGVMSIIEETKITYKKNKKQIAKRYFVSNLLNIKKIAQVIREHWAIESYHWLLDMVLFEDRCITKNINTTVNLNILRKVVLFLLKITMKSEFKNYSYEQFMRKQNVKGIQILANVIC